jgi:hypothetical protein
MAYSSPWIPEKRGISNSTSYTPTRWMGKIGDGPEFSNGFVGGGGFGEANRAPGGRPVDQRQTSLMRREVASYLPVFRQTAQSAGAPLRQQPSSITFGGLRADPSVQYNNEALIAAITAGLDRAEGRAASDRSRFAMGREGALDALSRGAFGEARALREELSAAGLGFSPRFAGRGQRAINERLVADQLMQEQAYLQALAEVERSLQDARDDAALRRAESEAQVVQSAAGLANVGDEVFYQGGA